MEEHLTRVNPTEFAFDKHLSNSFGEDSIMKNIIHLKKVNNLQTFKIIKVIQTSLRL